MFRKCLDYIIIYSWKVEDFCVTIIYFDYFVVNGKGDSPCMSMEMVMAMAMVLCVVKMYAK